MRKNGAAKALAGCVALILLAAGAGFLVAQEPVPKAQLTLEQEMARLNGSVQQVVQRIDQFLDRQEADLLMKRLEIHQMRQAPIEEELRRSYRTLEDFDEELEVWKSQRAMVEKQWEEEERQGTPVPDAEKERFELEFQSRQEQVLARQAAELRRIQGLENDLAAGREDMAILEEMLDEKLGLR